jgi:hypothetical protein
MGAVDRCGRHGIYAMRLANMRKRRAVMYPSSRCRDRSDCLRNQAAASITASASGFEKSGLSSSV